MLLFAACAGVVALLLAWGLSRWKGWFGPLVGCGFVWWLVVIGLVTMVPLAGIDLAVPEDAAQQTCSTDYGGPAPDGFWIFDGGQRLLNTVLFVPAGLLWVLLVSRWRAGLVLVPVGLVLLVGYSVGIEFAQLELSRISRACDVTDMVDNSLGALIGTGIGILALPVFRPWRHRTSR